MTDWASTPDEISAGASSADQRVGYLVAVNPIARAAECDCGAGWRSRQGVHLSVERDPAVLNAHTTRTEMAATLSARTLDTTVPPY